ncbi:endonuclease/exonuclease/phosphatase family protein [Patescibacteria group bacterium]
MQIKVMSWNTFLGHDIGGVIRHIHKENPGVIGLQEIVKGHPNTQGQNSVDLIRKGLSKMGRKHNVVYYPAFKSDRHSTRHEIGNAILSRFVVEKKSVHFLSDLEMYKNRDIDTVPRDAEPRIAVEVSIKVDTRSIRVIDTHLGVSEGLKPTKYTDVQMERLMGLIGEGKDTILMGDFNATPESEYIRRISGVMRNSDTDKKPTWPVLRRGIKAHQEKYEGVKRERSLLTHRIDQIFIGEGIQVVDFYLGDSLASDHKSLVAILEV